MYPTGQIFRWDSISSQSAATIDTTRFTMYEAYAASGAGTVDTLKSGARGGLYGATTLQDFGAGFLSLYHSTGVAASPIDSVKAQNVSPVTGARFVDVNAWTSATLPHQSAFYWDVGKATLTVATIDSMCKGVQSSTGASFVRIANNGAGSAVTTSVGDLNADGFNEKEGAYIYACDNDNTAHFTLYANGDTCRFTPAFRLTNYTAISAPQYVYVNTIPKVKDFGFNAYVKLSQNELVLQLADKICSNADIYISYDKTLAVTMTDFVAKAGDAAVSLLWNTQSEENNLGFFLYRRIAPGFLDSIGKMKDTIPADTDETVTPAMLLKAKIIKSSDTAWQQVNRRIIYGAMAGVSYGKRNYSWIDRQVYNDVKYDYKLVAEDFNSSRDVYDKTASAVPHRILPVSFDLRSNYPNPFKKITYIKFDLPVKTKVMLNVYSIQGRLVKQLIKPGKPLVPGYYRVSWDGRGDGGRSLAAGPYIYRITAQGYVKSKVMIHVR
jgi:hypothetical protein